MNKKISVIVPVYNVEKYLLRCVNSIQKQSYSDLEIILIDDGSPDHSGALCDELAKLDDRIVVIHQKNQGLSGARNAGIAIATGEYIAFVDSDDMIHPKLYETLISMCETKSLGICICHYLRFQNTNELLSGGSVKDQKTIEILTEKQALTRLHSMEGELYTVAWNKLYKANLFEHTRYPLRKINEDEFVTYRLIFEAKRIGVIENQYYYYFQNQESITTNVNYLSNTDVYEAFLERKNFFREIGETDYLPLIEKTELSRIINRYRMLKENATIKDKKAKLGKLHQLYQIQEKKSSQRKIKTMLFSVSPTLYFTCLKVKTIK